MDFNYILEFCEVGKTSPQNVGKNLLKLEEFYTKDEIVSIYEFFLTNISDSEILIQVIKQSDSYRTGSILKLIIEILEKRGGEDDSNINLRALCARAISNYKDMSSVTILLNCLNNKKEHYKVRLACADALGRIGDKYAVKPLIDVLEDDEEKSVYLKESATFALGLLGDTRAIEPLVSILESKQGFLGKFTFLKEKIVEALGKLNLNNKKVMKALKSSLMDSSPMVRINAIEAIMNSGDEDSISIIKPSLNDEDDEVKKNALIAIYNLSGRDILDEVIELPIYSNYLKQEAQYLIDEYEEEEDDDE